MPLSNKTALTFTKTDNNAINTIRIPLNPHNNGIVANYLYCYRIALKQCKKDKQFAYAYDVY